MIDNKDSLESVEAETAIVQENSSLQQEFDKKVLDLTQPLPPKSGETIYLTDGELIPWKSTWWRVKLREINGEKIVTLEKGKATAKSSKRSLRAERWNTQHANRKGVKREMKAALRVLRGNGLHGLQSGSPVSQQA
jgi:hypothetical protein